MPVIYLPQPVQELRQGDHHSRGRHQERLFASFGAARWEKGSDVLQSSIGRYLAANPMTPIRFAIQWIDDFRDPSGQWVRKDRGLDDSGKVTFITSYFEGDDYANWLGATSAVLLPYRQSAYGLRGSRVLLEAMVAGLPCITTEDTAPADDLTERGSGLLVKDNDSASLCAAIGKIGQEMEHFLAGAAAKREAAARYYSVANFKNLLLEHLHNLA